MFNIYISVTRCSISVTQIFEIKLEVKCAMSKTKAHSMCLIVDQAITGNERHVNRQPGFSTLYSLVLQLFFKEKNRRIDSTANW